MTDFEVGLRLTADGRAVVTESRKAGREVDRYRESTRQAGSEAERSGRRIRRFGDDTRRAGADARRSRGEIGGLTRQMTQLRNVAAGIAGLSIGAGLAQGLRRATRESLSFSDALAEVQTLINASREDVELLTTAAREQAATFGSTPTAQANALYQIISSGASSAREAVLLLDASNRLALGGVTEVRTAADGLTTILNSYGRSAEDATEISDALFVAMRSGKTTIGELSQEFGVVGPLAEQTGVGIEQLLAAVAALTLGGTQTNVAMTGLRQVLANVVKPTAEARKEAERLGIDFSTTALRAKGLAGFLGEINDAAGGSEASLAQLFGNVESLVPVLGLAGRQSDAFNKILEQMGDRAGSTEDAVQEMLEALGVREAGALSKIGEEFRDLADILAEDYVGALEATAENLDTITTVATTAATVLGGRFAASLAISGLTAFIAANQSAIAGLVLMSRVAPGAAAGLTAVGAAAATARGALALLGGPVGIAAATAASLYIYRDSIFAAMEATEQQVSALEQLNALMEVSRDLNEDQARLVLADTQASLANARATREQTAAELEQARARKARQLEESRSAGPGGFLGTTAAGVADATSTAPSAGIAAMERELSQLDVTIARNEEFIESLELRLAQLRQGLSKTTEETREASTANRDAGEEAEAFARKLAAVVGGLDPAAARAARYAEQVTVLAEAHQRGAISGERLADLLARLNSEIYPTSEEFLSRIHGQMVEEQRLLSMSAQEREVERAVRERVLEAQAAGIELTDKEIRQLREWTRAQAQAEDQAEKRAEIERRAAAEVTDIWQEARRSVQDLFADEVFSALEGELNSVEDIADSFVSIWKRAYAEAFTAQVFQGFQGGGGGGLFGVGSLFGQSGPGGDTPTVELANTGILGDAMSGLTRKIDDLGTNLGFAAPQPVVGPPVANPGLTLSQGAGGAFSGLGAGFAGYGIGQSVGGMLGLGATGSGALGGALGGGLAVSAVSGTALGAKLGIAGGPLGIAIGAGIGAILGGIAGALSDNDTPSTGVGLTGDMSSRVASQGGADADVARKLREAVNVGLDAIADNFGSGVAPREFGRIAQRKGDPFNFQTAGEPFGARQKFDSAEGAVLAAIKEGVRAGVVTGLDDRAESIIRNSDATTPDKLLEDLGFLETFDQLVKAGRQTSDFVDQIKSLNATFVDAIRRARDLGLETEALTDARERSIAKIRGDFERQTELAILDLTNPVRAALERQRDESRQFLLDAAAVGADLDQARRRVRLDRQALIEELSTGAERMATAFREDITGILNEIRFGERSGLSNQERLPVLLSRFESLAARAPTDEQARGELDSAARDLLDLAGESYASSAQFYEIQRNVENRLEQLAAVGIETPDVQAIADEIGAIELDPEFQRLMEDIGAEIAESNAEVVEILSEIRDGMSAGSGQASPWAEFGLGSEAYGRRSWL